MFSLNRDPLLHLEWLDEIGQLARKIAEEGGRLQCVKVSGSLRPSLMVLVATGTVAVVFTDYEDAKNRVYGLR